MIHLDSIHDIYQYTSKPYIYCLPTWCLLSRNDTLTQRDLRCIFLQLVVYDHFLIPIALKN